MSGIFYVWLKFTQPEDDVASATIGRHMLLLSSRYEADELFRAMQRLQLNGNYFPLLVRKSPQFWCYNSPWGWGAIHYIQTQGRLPAQFKESLSSVVVSNMDAFNWATIQNSITGPDWVSGGHFFIRNRRQPNIYWWVHDTHIHASEQQRSKFRVTALKIQDVRSPVILVRQDTITVEVIPETVTSDAVANGATYVAVQGSRSGRLEVTGVKSEWSFESLLCKDVGVRWEKEQCFVKSSLAAAPWLIHMPNGGGDEWELC
ncbi:hypothetical protein RUND412_007279 [Rhizina undulata]